MNFNWTKIQCRFEVIIHYSEVEMKSVSSKIIGLVISLTCASGFAQEAVQNTAAPVAEDKKVEQPAKLEEVKKEEAQAKSEELTKTEQAPAADVSSEHYFGLNASLGLPHPLNIGLDYIHSSKIFSVGLAAGSFSLKQDGAEVGIGNSDVALRWHPFMGSFYIGALLGQQKIVGKKTETISGQSITAEIEIKSGYTTPVLGWMWGSSNGGFFAGMELGYQSPSGVKSSLTTNADNTIKATQEYKDLEKDARDAADKIGNTSLPHIALLKIGWLF